MQESKEPSSTMLYVSNLPFTFEDSDLKGVFVGYELVSAYVATRRNGRSKGFGFVTFSTPDQQQKALASIDGKELSGRTLSVKVAHKDDRRDDRGELREEFKTEVQREPRKKRENAIERPAERGDRATAPRTPSETVLYVSNLPFEFTDDDLRKLFAPYKPSSARIATRRTGRSKGFGFVEFPSKQEQNNALTLDGHMIGERQIGVKISVTADRTGDNADNSNSNNNNNNANKREGGDRKPKPKAPASENNNNSRPASTTKKTSERAPAPSRERTPASTEPSDTTVYVSNLPFDLSDEGLAKIFADKGHKCVVARIARRRDDRSKGFGFVEFASHADQQSSLALDALEFSERAISVKVAKKGSETRGEDTAAEDKPRRAPRRENNTSNNNNNNNKDREGGDRAAAAPKKPSDTLVYVSNLSFDVDDNALAKIFDGLSIKSAHVAVRRNGRSKGFGFVEFASHAEQQKALSKSGTELVGRTLSVEVANEKQAE